ncbi:MAG TPA: serine/threonine-protein kinase [Streptosporangiaceae bacterium]|nr:serine/threonine-protein kinase [Streptosporangiaceae bacterium]
MSSPQTLLAASRYRLEEKIGAGGYGEVWRATDVLLGRPVAVKQLPPDRARSPQALIRFRAEAQRAGSLSHENVTRVYDYVEPASPDPPFLVMELVDGPSAAQVLAGGALHPARTMSILAEAGAGLQAAHEAGLVHRDIKPSNLLLTRDGQVKVTDFGISYALNTAPMTSSNTLLGTTGYVAPERLNGGGVAASGDLYALGIVAWECLTGRPPFSGTPIEVVVAHRDQPLPPLPASVPAEVAVLVAELTAKDPAQRPASAGDVARRAAGLRDRLAREAGVSACPLAGSWFGADGGPSGPIGVSTIASSEVFLFKRAFDRPQPPPGQPGQGPDQPGQGPGDPGQRPGEPGQGRVRRRPGRQRLAVGAAAAAIAITAVIVTQMIGMGTVGDQAAPPAGHRAPTGSAARQAGGHRTVTVTSRARPAAARAVGSPVPNPASQAGRGSVGTARSTPSVTGGSVATTPSSVPTPSAGTGNGKAKGRGNGKGNGQGNGNGKGNG